jgi:light-regulated signal transduction histidine kinase (bacteriophytochrome)
LTADAILRHARARAELVRWIRRLPFAPQAESGRGTGLGLALVHGIVTVHRGRIEVESPAGEGTTFQVWLPRRRPAASGSEAHERARTDG